MYKSGSLFIAETCFINAGKPLDPGSLTSLSATATDCRVVFLRAETHPERIGAYEMPCVDNVKRSGRRVMQGLLIPGETYDLGVVLSSEGGKPLLLHTRSDGSFVLREIDEALYVSALVERSNPIVNADELPEPVRELPRPSGEGWTGAVILTR